ncbi:HPr kinase/phosphatase C-terminal domain-containing protein [Tabrizicola sp.]|uniref:HPr kinase/phosphorylase n=1 Tax=Tabrizicola sp. TaxID=2005166 RepID=UPI001A3829D7|nr:HPr kinase/phosphatase C-terminal domain-containing protein [Tabrizicola sp.]MBL9073779.1 HPr kinase/phosphatase C-terminal domain-containing protein [Tabrizicola sp.]
MTAASDILHASCIAVEGCGLLILGPSGAGKSSLAIRLMALGAGLVSDDRTLVSVRDGRLVADCPRAAMRGLIEARGIGLLRAPVVDPVPLALAIDLGQPEPDRLPPFRTVTILGIQLPLVLHPQNDHFPDALMLYLRHGRQR